MTTMMFKKMKLLEVDKHQTVLWMLWTLKKIKWFCWEWLFRLKLLLCFFLKRQNFCYVITYSG